MKMCLYLQSVEIVWVISKVSKMGFVLWAPWSQNTAWKCFEEKNLASLCRLLWSFSSLEKGRICFCARWNERTFSVPDEFSENFGFLHCLIAVWSSALQEVQPSCHLSPYNLRFHLLRIFISFQRQVVVAPELTDFSSSSFFQRGNWWWGYRRCKVKKSFS